MGPVAPASERLVRSLLRANPPCISAVQFARALERRRGEPEDEVARVVHHLRDTLEVGALDAGIGLGELVVNVLDRDAETAAAVVAGLRAAWVRPTPTQADALAVASACVELAAARPRLSGIAFGLFRFLLDPMRPPAGHPGFAGAVERARKELTPAVLQELAAAESMLPLLSRRVKGDLLRVGQILAAAPS